MTGDDPFASYYSGGGQGEKYLPTDEAVQAQLGTRVFEFQQHDWGSRFVATAGPTPIGTLLSLVKGLEREVWLLYVLVVDFEDHEPGRYETQLIPWEEVEAGLTAYTPLLEKDGRQCLWIANAEQSWQVIYDRHELFYLYGDAEWFEARLRANGYEEAPIAWFGPHYHSYLREYDASAAELLQRWEFTRKELMDGDVE